LGYIRAMVTSPALEMARTLVRMDTVSCNSNLELVHFARDTLRRLGVESRLTFDATGRVAYINEQMIELSAREISLLEVLLQRAGRLVSKDQLVTRLCEWGEEVSNNAIEVYIHRLRKKIEQGPIRIATVRGLGLRRLNSVSTLEDTPAVRGMINKKIAGELGTTERTVKAHRHEVMEKMQVNSLAELVSSAVHLGVIVPDLGSGS